jgi:hypothetical protein
MTTSLTRSVRIVLGVAIGAAALTSIACKDFLKVQDPGRFTNEALDNATVLTAVANGVEGQFQQIYDDFVVYTGLNSDELSNSSTWIDWADMGLGRVRGDWPTAPGNTWVTAQDELLRTRFTAQNAADRLTRVLGTDAASKSPLMAQVKVYDAWADLALGMGYCEAPLVQNGPRAPDTELYKQAITKFGTALTVAQAAAQPAWINFALAGRARANLLAGNYDAALADAQAVSAGFIKQAVYSVNSATTLTGNQLHYNRNRSGGLNALYWSMVDTSNSNNGAVNPVQYVKDPWTGTPDQRMAVSHKAGGVAIGVDNKTKHYAIQKYSDYTNPITLTSKREMNLIEAEVAWRKGNLQTAIDDLNRNRTTAPAPLPAFDATGLTSTDVRDRILSERFAELFVEGHRMTDLDRFGLVTAKLGTGRARKYPMSRNEILNNPSLKQNQATCPAIS